jgi:hypothetical protein
VTVRGIDAPQRIWRPSDRVSFVFAGPMCKGDVFSMYSAGSSMKAVLPFLCLALAFLAVPPQLSAQNSLIRPHDDAVVVLISEQEAALPSGKKSPVALAGNIALDDRAITRNPKIFAVSPTEAATNSPIHFAIKFLAFNGAQIDPKLVRLTYLKQSPIDLTGRIAAFILGDGIDVPRALVAPGKHLIQIDVVDTEGRETSKILALDVTR